jgi:hypothetical protein
MQIQIHVRRKESCVEKEREREDELHEKKFKSVEKKIGVKREKASINKILKIL